MIKIFACFIYPLIIHFSYLKVPTKSKLEIRNYINVFKDDNVHFDIRYQSEKYDAISFQDLFFFNGIKSLAVTSITPTNIEKIFGKPKRVEKGYSEMDDDDTITYSYRDGDITFLVKQKMVHIDVKGPGWSFGIKNNAGKVQNFSTGDNLGLLKKVFLNSYQNPINSVYINLKVRTSSGILSDSFLSFEVDKSINKIISISLIQ